VDFWIHIVELVYSLLLAQVHPALWPGYLSQG